MGGSGSLAEHGANAAARTRLARTAALVGERPSAAKRVGSSQAVFVVRPDRVQQGLALRPLPNVGVDGGPAGTLMRGHTVEAVGKPVRCSIVKDDDGREGAAVL